MEPYGKVAARQRYLLPLVVFLTGACVLIVEVLAVLDVVVERHRAGAELGRKGSQNDVWLPRLDYGPCERLRPGANQRPAGWVENPTPRLPE